ncbi:pyridine nucleotide-disulfide oxidoreductase [Streptomyces sp. NPDC047014]|uniref:pyridine nucleotide-disulfide oxidoreductase n=1 Tax=Streptomyces sp. NPDC047014 TaxID=3155736 RepID=UPI0034052DBE
MPPDAHPRARRALVLGGGLAGSLAAAALAPYCDSVVIVERHALPDEPRPRRGLPQARHAHMLWAGGADAIEALLPGTTALWTARGARRVSLPNGMVSLSPGGWYRRCWPEVQYLISASRDLLDWGVRTRLLDDPRVTLLTGTEPLRLLGTASRVTGATVRRPDGSTADLEAELVVDAMGRTSPGTGWLAALGVPEVPETVIDAGVTYASRRYRAPRVPADWPVINIQADSRLPMAGRAATILPIEDGAWLVSVSGTRGGEPSSDEARFEEFTQRLRSPLVAEYLARAEPAGPVTVTRTTANRRRHFEKVRMPEGFLAIGEAATSLNPVYGHGMSVAAQSARALHALAARQDIAARGFARRAQRAIGRPAAAAWLLGADQDILFPGAEGRRPTRADRLAGRYVHRLIRTACSDLTVVRALTDVMTLQTGAAALAHPKVLLAALRGPRLPALDGPALTPEEESVKTAPGRDTPYGQEVAPRP